MPASGVRVGLTRALGPIFSFANGTGKSKVRAMSLAEVEQQLLQLSEEERHQFAAWFFQNQGKILPPPIDDGADKDGEVTETMRTELLLRKQEYFDHPERFRRVTTKGELNAYFDEVRDEVRHRLSSVR